MADPMQGLTLQGIVMAVIALCIVLVATTAWQLRPEIIAVVKTIWHRYIAFQWHGVQGDDTAFYDISVKAEEMRDQELPHILSSDARQTRQTDADRPGLSALSEAADKLRLDRSRTALIRVLVLAGWDVGDIRSKLKGDNGVIGEEIGAAKNGLTVDTSRQEEASSQRTILVRDNGQPAREISL